jgi:hypothetical protein
MFEVGNKLPKLAGVKFSGLGRIVVGVDNKVGLSAVAQALKSAELTTIKPVNRRRDTLRMIIAPK